MAWFDGGRHCERIRGAFETQSPETFALSSRQCSFGRKGIDMLLCAERGAYVAAVAEIEGARYATLNMIGADIRGLALGTVEPVDYDNETDTARLARRRAKWTPASLIETASLDA